LAFDSVGNLFVATNFSDNITVRCTILKISPDGRQNVFAILGGYVGQGVAIDLADNVFVMTYNSIFRNRTHAVIYKFTPGGARMPFGFLDGDQGFGLAFDNAGNLFAAGTVAQNIYKFGPDGTRSVFAGPSAFPRGRGDGPIGLAFDQFGNLFVSTEIFPFNNDTILEFSPSGVESTFATGLNFPRGLTFDSAGNLFVAEIPGEATGDILKFKPDGTSTIFASGIGIPQGNGGPEFLAIQP
jgi:DNA-binding beta-propeller fold protein YncE